MLVGCAPLHIFDAGSVTAQRYKDGVLEPHGRLFQGAIGQDFNVIFDNTRSQTELILSKTFLRKRESAGWICQQNLMTEHVWDILGSHCSMSIPSKQVPDIEICFH
ncbi:hypothetical protein TNCV_1401831 [Trichonephila clavipes]|nr:hypothetical protein TNCV_1401831 [Trichonephila clavipes]